MSKHSKAKCYAEGGLVEQVKAVANRLVGNNPAAQQQRGRNPDAIGLDKPMSQPAGAPPAPMATNPGYKSGIPTKDNPAGIRFAKGGKVPGPRAETTDTVPAMLTPGEFVVRKDAVKHVGVKALEAINALGGKKPGKAAARAALGPRRGMQAGGLVEELPQFQRPVPGAGAMLEAQMNPTSQAMVANARTAPPMSVAPPAPTMTTSPGATGFTPQPRQPYNLVTQVMDAQRPPQFTTAPGAAAPTNAVNFVNPPEPISATTAPGAAPQAPRVPAGPAVALDAGGPGAVRNPNVARGILSAEGAAATQEISQQAAAQRAASASAAAPQAAAPAAAPTAPTAPAGPTTMQSARAALSNGMGAVRSAANSPLVRGVAPIAAATGAINAADTSTEAYRQRFGIGPNEGDNPYSMAARDVGVRALGVASDVGNALFMGLPGLFYRDKQSPVAQTLTPPDPGTRPAAAPAAPPAAAPGAAPGAATPAAAALAPPAPTNVTRVGNSYSGPANIEGDITVNGAAPRGGVSVMPGFGGGLGQSGADQALQAARMAAIQRGDVESVKASFGGDFGPKVDPVQALMNNGRPMTSRKAAAIADLMRAGGNPDDRAKTKAETEGRRLENDAARQLLRATTALAKAKTPAEQVQAIEVLRALQGKYEKELPNRFTVVPGGDEIGPDGVTTIKRPARVFNNQTGTFVDEPAKKAPAGNFEKDKVYVDGKGNRAKWDGTKFVPA